MSSRRSLDVENFLVATDLGAMVENDHVIGVTHHDELYVRIFFCDPQRIFHRRNGVLFAVHNERWRGKLFPKRIMPIVIEMFEAVEIDPQAGVRDIGGYAPHVPVASVEIF